MIKDTKLRLKVQSYKYYKEGYTIELFGSKDFSSCRCKHNKFSISTGDVERKIKVGVDDIGIDKTLYK